MVALAAEEAIPTLHPPRAELLPSFWEQHGWSVAIAVVVVLGALAFWVNWRRRSKPVMVTPPDVLARRGLAALRGRPEDVTLVVDVSRILRRYVTSAFDLPPDEFTTAELAKALQSHPRANPELTAALVHFLRSCDERKFAPAEWTSAEIGRGVLTAPYLPAGLAAQSSGAAARALELIEKVEAHRQQTLTAAPAQPSTGTVPPSAP